MIGLLSASRLGRSLALQAGPTPSCALRGTRVIRGLTPARRAGAADAHRLPAVRSEARPGGREPGKGERPSGPDATAAARRPALAGDGVHRLLLPQPRRDPALLRV